MALLKNIINRISGVILRVYLRYKYRFYGCIIKSKVKLNNITKLESNIFIGKGSNIENSSIGYGTYLSDFCDFKNCKIGRFCSVASSSKIILGTHPTEKIVSTHPAFFSSKKQAGFTFTQKDLFEEYKYADNKNKLSVIIGNDVWIGYGVKILEGIKIGDGAIIGACSLVTKDVKSYEIVGGIPAKKIGDRFNEDEVKFLNDFKWWQKDISWIKNNYKLFIDINNFYKDLYKD